MIVDGKEEVATVSIERSFAAMNAEGEMASIEKVRGDGAKPEQGDYVTYFKYDVNGSFWGMKLDWELFYTLIAGMGTLLTILGTMLIQPVVRKFGKKETWLSCFVISGLVSLVFIVLGKDSFSTIIIFNWLFSLIIAFNRIYHVEYVRRCCRQRRSKDRKTCNGFDLFFRYHSTEIRICERKFVAVVLPCSSRVCVE